METNKISALDLRKRFGEVLDRVRYSKEPLIVTKNGRSVIVMMDIDLYQAQKAIDNGALALADGGILLLVASCRDGVGDRAYIELLGSSGSPGKAMKRISEGYRLGYHKAAKIAQVASRASLRAISELDAATLKMAFIEKKHSLQDAFSEALAEKGPGARVAVLLDGTVTVPLID